MKRILLWCVVTVLLIVSFAGCSEVAEVVEQLPIDVRHTEAHDSIETDYQYKYNMWKGEYVLVPVVKTVHHEETWSVQYRITYDNGKQKTKWIDCTELEYERIKAMLEEEVSGE